MTSKIISRGRIKVIWRMAIDMESNFDCAIKGIVRQNLNT